MRDDSGEPCDNDPDDGNHDELTDLIVKARSIEFPLRALAHRSAADRTRLAGHFATRVDAMLAERLAYNRYGDTIARLDAFDEFVSALNIHGLQPVMGPRQLETPMWRGRISWRQLAGMFLLLLAEHVARRGDPADALTSEEAGPKAP